jgi:hypothetical protein
MKFLKLFLLIYSNILVSLKDRNILHSSKQIQLFIQTSIVPKRSNKINSRRNEKNERNTIPKSGDNKVFNNDRTIILPAFSKILEQIVSNRLVSSLE